jgi:hypothetical protein
MPITKPSSTILYTEGHDNDRTLKTDVHPADTFAICDAKDPLKQLQFDLSSMTAGTTSTVKLTTTGFFSYYDSAVSTGGSATEALTFTGLAAADTVLALFIKTKGANSVSIVGTGTQSANTLSVTFSADPGANAVLRALVSKA